MATVFGQPSCLGGVGERVCSWTAILQSVTETSHHFLSLILSSAYFRHDLLQRSPQTVVGLSAPQHSYKPPYKINPRSKSLQEGSISAPAICSAKHTAKHQHTGNVSSSSRQPLQCSGEERTEQNRNTTSNNTELLERGAGQVGVHRPPYERAPTLAHAT